MTGLDGISMLGGLVRTATSGFWQSPQTLDAANPQIPRLPLLSIAVGAEMLRAAIVFQPHDPIPRQVDQFPNLLVSTLAPIPFANFDWSNVVQRVGRKNLDQPPNLLLTTLAVQAEADIVPLYITIDGLHYLSYGLKAKR